MNSSNKIKIHQAIYGEVNQSHGCLYSTVNDVDLKAFLTAFTDRPSAIPPGMKMKPYYSAIKFKQYYLISLSFADDDAVRAGMIFTHVLILNLNDINFINNLKPLLNLFFEEKPKDKVVLEQLIIEKSEFESLNFQTSFEAYTLNVVQKLSSGALPILFCGDSDRFVRLITDLWVGLPKSFRPQISFTVGFIASNIDLTKTFIHFQRELNVSLKNINFISDEDRSLVTPQTTVEKFILTPSADNEFEKFISDLDINLNDWNVLQMSAMAYEGYLKISQLNNDRLKQLLRQVEKVSPDLKNGTGIKAKIISELENRLKNGVETNLKSLRNLPLDGFYSGEKTLQSAVRFFVNKELGDSTNFDDTLLSEIIIISQNEIDKNWLYTGVVEAVKNSINKKTSHVIENLWKLMIKSIDSLSVIWSFVPRSNNYENILIQHLPNTISPQIIHEILKLTADKDWIILHSHILLKKSPPDQALLQQFGLEKKLKINDNAGSHNIINKVMDSELLSIAMTTQEQFFILEYANRCSINATLLQDLDVRNDIWLSIWNYTLKQSKDLSIGVIDLPDKIDLLLDQISNGENVPSVIIDLIAHSSFADVSKFKNRASFWKYLIPEIKNFFLLDTANSILKEVSSTGLSGIVLEEELTEFIAADSFMTNFLSANRNDLNTVLEVYEYIPNLKDNFLSDYVNYYSNTLNDIQSERLGNLVNNKKFYLTAREIFEKAKNNDSYRIALNKCESIIQLGLFDNIFYAKIFGRTVSKEDTYSAFIEICIQLYPLGPEEKQIWKRAGGDISKLHQYKTREENWIASIELLKHGGGGKLLSFKTLIHEMSEDYPNNTQLKHIIKYF